AHGRAFGVEEQQRELRVDRSHAGGTGRRVVRFQQVHRGVPVLAGELNVNLDAAGNVLSAAGELLPDVDVGVTPSLSRASARRAALEQVAKTHGVGRGGLTVTPPQLWIYDARLIGGPGVRTPTLVWRMTVERRGGGDIRELVLVDAQLGKVALHFNQVAHAKTRYVCNRNNVVGAAEACTGSYSRWEGQPATGNRDVDLAYTYSGWTYDFFADRFRRDSLDNNGMALRSTVKYCPNADNCPFANAYWNGRQMVYGDGYASADDVVGHELAHGVTDHTSHLLYWYQSGAINESLSDVFGELIDQDFDGANDNDASTVRWRMGEDLSIGAIRNMKNPPEFGDPDRIGSANYWSDPLDNGGVHINSGVNNKAAYLLVDGGSFNGRTVSALGLTKTARIYYEAQSNLLTSGSDYGDLYTMLYQACQQLIGSGGITAADCGEVRDATLATEMNRQPVTGATNPEAPICPIGKVPYDRFYDNLENPTKGNWQKGAVQGSSSWAYPQNPNAYAGYDATFATSGRYNMWGDDPGVMADFWIAKKQAFTPPAGKTTYLRFSHAYGFEAGSEKYDGGVVEYRVDGGSWRGAGALFTDNGHNGTISTSGDNPLGGRRAFVGHSHGYRSSRLDLTSLAGRSVRFRFRIGTDSLVGNYGWYIDDLRVYTCGSPPALSTTNTLRNAGFEHDADNDSFADGWTLDNGALRSNDSRRFGMYSVRHQAFDDETYSVRQVVGGIDAGRRYDLTAHLRAPTTSREITFTVDVQWLTARNRVIATSRVRRLLDDTGGAWVEASRRGMVAPTGVAKARVRMVNASRNAATIYADGFVFKRSAS
ncbi:MAG: M4 family metallopeptidase, partial [Actinomycetota bacterium]|nr:M4 family metallopeptidase [Actinomycetota bacterium]